MQNTGVIYQQVRQLPRLVCTQNVKNCSGQLLFYWTPGIGALKFACYSFQDGTTAPDSCLLPRIFHGNKNRF
jgi:hypothetical protein